MKKKHRRKRLLKKEKSLKGTSVRMKAPPLCSIKLGFDRICVGKSTQLLEVMKGSVS